MYPEEYSQSCESAQYFIAQRKKWAWSFNAPYKNLPSFLA